MRFGRFAQLTPASRHFGFDRGLPVDRYYIEAFLRQSSDIQGAVLEVGDNEYTKRFGGWESHNSRVSSSDVLHLDANNPRATIVGDLALGDNLPKGTFDCVICTQTLHLIYDLSAAVASLHRLLKPGGVALVSVPGISQICRSGTESWGDHWRFTTLSAKRVFEQSFPREGIHVEAYGNVMSSVAFLHGLATEELSRDQLETRDSDFQLLITIRAVKATPS